ncbi:MAG: hypothetical protein ACTSX6_06055 [Candidatus Heimdallarchaeaceae archaeon]
MTLENEEETIEKEGESTLGKRGLEINLSSLVKLFIYGAVLVAATATGLGMYSGAKTALEDIQEKMNKNPIVRMVRKNPAVKLSTNIFYYLDDLTEHMTIRGIQTLYDFFHHDQRVTIVTDIRQYDSGAWSLLIPHGIGSEKPDVLVGMYRDDDKALYLIDSDVDRIVPIGRNGGYGFGIRFTEPINSDAPYPKFTIVFADFDSKDVPYMRYYDGIYGGEGTPEHLIIPDVVFLNLGDSLNELIHSGDENLNLRANYQLGNVGSYDVSVECIKTYNWKETLFDQIPIIGVREHERIAVLSLLINGSPVEVPIGTKEQVLAGYDALTPNLIYYKDPGTNRKDIIGFILPIKELDSFALGLFEPYTELDITEVYQKK